MQADTAAAEQQEAKHNRSVGAKPIQQICVDSRIDGGWHEITPPRLVELLISRRLTPAQIWLRSSHGHQNSLIIELKWRSEFQDFREDHVRNTDSN